MAQPAIEIASCHQLVMGPDVGDLPMIHHDHPVGQRDHAYAMRDHERRAIARKFLQHVEDQLLALNIDLACRLVEQQNFGIAEDRAGERNSLPLAA